MPATATIVIPNPSHLSSSLLSRLQHIGLSSAELARRSEVSPVTVWRLVAKKINSVEERVLQNISGELDVSVDDLLYPPGRSPSVAQITYLEFLDAILEVPRLASSTTPGWLLRDPTTNSSNFRTVDRLDSSVIFVAGYAAARRHGIDRLISSDRENEKDKTIDLSIAREIARATECLAHGKTNRIKRYAQKAKVAYVFSVLFRCLERPRLAAKCLVESAKYFRFADDLEASQLVSDLASLELRGD